MCYCWLCLYSVLATCWWMGWLPLLTAYAVWMFPDQKSCLNSDIAKTDADLALRAYRGAMVSFWALQIHVQQPFCDSHPEVCHPDYPPLSISWYWFFLLYILTKPTSSTRSRGLALAAATDIYCFVAGLRAETGLLIKYIRISVVPFINVMVWRVRSPKLCLAVISWVISSKFDRTRTRSTSSYFDSQVRLNYSLCNGKPSSVEHPWPLLPR